MPRRKQSKRVASDLSPSEVVDEYWLYAERTTGGYPEHTGRGGKWLVFVPVVAIDEVWARIKDATEKGLLGSAAKVATARPNSNATSSDARVICVYTYDWADEGDVRRTTP